MALVKCPRCELNYMEEGSKYCKVCMAELFGDSKSNETEMCIECGEHEPLPGDEVCFFCMRERKRQESLEKANDVKTKLDVKDLDKIIDNDDDDDDDDDDGLDVLNEIDEIDDIDEIDELDEQLDFDGDDESGDDDDEDFDDNDNVNDEPDDFDEDFDDLGDDGDDDDDDGDDDDFEE